MKIRTQEGVTVSDCVRNYLAHLDAMAAAGEYSHDHLANVRRDLANFESFTGNGAKDVGDLRQHDLTAWLSRQTKWKSVYTKRNAVSAIVACFRYAEDEERIDRSPFRRPRALRGAKGKPRRPATAEEYLSLIRGGSRALRRALFFLWHTGARTCEMREATWADVTFGDCPRIVLFTHKTARKTGKSRMIALNVVAAKFLAWLKSRATSAYVFTNCDGSPWDRHTFARHLRRTAKRLGLDEGVNERVSGYCIRHSYTCAALTAGFTSKEVADQLGHVDTKMVERVYGSHTQQDVAYLSRLAENIRVKRA